MNKKTAILIQRAFDSLDRGANGLLDFDEKINEAMLSADSDEEIEGINFLICRIVRAAHTRPRAWA
ncbi:MAG: hypothetical protein FJ110_04615 [Deltaproteobacteria bacterium]|nr:hypothetical protein [Deltaproteobacteria bacterium]